MGKGFFHMLLDLLVLMHVLMALVSAGRAKLSGNNNQNARKNVEVLFNTCHNGECPQRYGHN